jgi:hypothetical protein
VRYPAAADWSSNGAGVGLEPPLGLDVNALEPTGEAHELVGPVAPSVSQSTDVVETGSDHPLPKLAKRRRIVP